MNRNGFLHSLERHRIIRPGDYEVVGIIICRLIALPFIGFFILLKVRPNAVTALSFIVFTLGGYTILSGAIYLGAFLIGLGALLDFCDGALARFYGNSSKFGWFIDYSGDRIKSLIFFYAMLFSESRPWLKILLVVAGGAVCFKEIQTWAFPYERCAEKRGIGVWEYAFGRHAWLAHTFIRNDPWQLVATGALGVLFLRDGLTIGATYYAASMIIDCGVLFYSHMNISPNSEHKEMLIKKPGFSYRTGVWKRLRRIRHERTGEK